MTITQAKRLGSLLIRARMRQGLSIRALADRTDISGTWISDVEAGRFREPAADRLARIAEVLDIEPRILNEVTRGAVSGGLPGLRTYFRAKYDLTPEQVAQVERYVENLRKDQS